MGNEQMWFDSAATMEEFALWQAFDDAMDTHCFLPAEDAESEYVDLLLNPERFTGYRGNSAHRIWQSIYLENCFRLVEICCRIICNVLSTLFYNFYIWGF